MPMPHRTFAQVAKRRLVGKEGRERIREVNALLAELPDYKNGPYADLRKWLPRRDRGHRASGRTPSTATRSPSAARARPRSRSSGRRTSASRRILQALSEIQIKTGDYPFTTLRPVPALTRIGGVLVQLVEIPGLIEGATDDRGGGRALLGVLRSADAIVYCARADARSRRSSRSVRAEVALAGIDKPAFLAATRADEAEPGDRSRALARRSRTSRSSPVSVLDEASPRRVPRRRLAPDRPDPGPTPRTTASTDAEPLALDPARRSPTSPTGSTTTSRRPSAARGSGARRPGSTASASVATTRSSTATSWRSCIDAVDSGFGRSDVE